MAEEQNPAPAKKAASGWLNLLIDYGPLVVFFGAYKYYSRGHAEIYGVIHGTIAFIVASIAALALSKWRLGKISPMLWLSTLLIVGFGLVTILLRDQFWIQVKPTAIYLLFGAVLLGGYWQGKAVLKWLLEAAFDGLSDLGWMKLSRNWGWFFLFFAVLNEVLRHFLSFGDWLAAKIWVFLPLSFLFTFLHLPMLMRHGLGEEAKEEEETTIPPP
jgi:intracellular septation protein